MSARPGLCGGHQATGVPTAMSLTQTSRRSRITYEMGDISTTTDSRNCLTNAAGAISLGFQHETLARRSE